MLIHWPGLLCEAAIKSKWDRGNKTLNGETKMAEMPQLRAAVTVVETYMIVLQKRKKNVPKHVQLHY